MKYPIVLSTPRRLTDVTAWHGLIPVAFALTSLHRPKVFVELGTHKGDSYCAFCQAVDELALPTRCYAVDTWQGDPQAGFYGEAVYEELRAYHDPLYGRFSSLLRMTFDDALSHFPDGEIDLLHIDGLHTYEAVKHDFESWLPKMTSRGVVVLHDVAVHEKDFGVFKLWQEIVQRYPARLFGFSHGLGIVAVGQEAVAGELKAWFASGEEEWQRIERLFAALGERLTRQDHIKVLQLELEGKRCELASAAQQIAQEHQAWQRWSEEKSSEITRLQTALQDQQAELERIRADLQKTRAELERTRQEKQAELQALNQRAQQARMAEHVLQEILGSWLWRFLGRHLLPIPESVEASFMEPVGLVEYQALHLPAYLWPRAGKTLGGMRKFLAPVEILGEHIAIEGGALAVQAREGRLWVRLDGLVEAGKVVLKVAGGQAVRLRLEFGELAPHLWHPVAKQEVMLLPGRPCVLYLRLPKAVEAMALVFPEPGQVNFSQIAVLAISPLEYRLGPWLQPLQQGVDLLRARPWRRLERAVKRYGWNGTLHMARQRLMAGADAALPSPKVAPNFCAQGEDPYAYMAGGREVNLFGRRLAVLASRGGNFFMREIGLTIAKAAEKIGAEVVVGDEQDKIDLQKCDWIVVVAPHEFFTLGKGVGRFSYFARWAERLLLVNTEQPQTQWFRTAWEFLPSARAVLDINYQTALYLRQMGVRAYFLPLGYAPTSVPGPLPDHPAFLHLPPQIRNCTPTSYQERPLDVVFVGTASPRRKAFFARHAPFFAGLETFIYLPEGDRPFVPRDQRTLDFAMLSGLIQRAKIVLNVHRDEHPYLEWQRIVNLGIMQQTLVLSEHCDFCPAVRANQDYLDVPLDLIPTVCAHYLAHPEEAERFALSAFARVQSELPMEKVLSCLFFTLETS
ncbi:MAG: class I SAM-dependent methyltransferase [Methylohalobius sp.]|nr:class I SAM-dependent methyltransferase [Methylohalobius sp.]